MNSEGGVILNKALIVAALVCISCTTADDARNGTRKLLAQLGLRIAAIACVGEYDDPTGHASTCNVRTVEGELIVTHCNFSGWRNGCAIVRPGAEL